MVLSNKKIFLLLLVLFFPKISWALEISIEPQNFSQDQHAILIISGNDLEDFTLPVVKGLSFQALGSSKSMSYINGSFRSSTSKRFAVKAADRGDYIFPSIKLKEQGRLITTKPITLTVTKATKTSSSLASLEFTLNQNAYVGEKVPVTLSLFVNNAQQAELSSPPKLVADNIIFFSPTTAPKQVIVEKNGSKFTKVSWQAWLTPLKIGDTPLSFSLALTFHQQQNSPFNDPFFNSFFQQSRKVKREINSSIFTLHSLQLPIGAPKSFSGAVGDFQLQQESKSNKLTPGEALLLSTTIYGQGNWNNVILPSIKSKAWRSYQTAVNQKDDRKTFTERFLPQESGNLSLPSREWSFFNPKTKQYHTLHSQTLQIMVTDTSPHVQKKDTTPPSLEEKTLPPWIQPVQKKTGATAFPSKTVWFQITTLLLTSILFFLIFLRLAEWRRRKNPQAFLEKKQKRKALQALNKMTKTQLSTEDFYQEIISIIRSYMAPKLSIEVNAISAKDLQQHKIFSAILEEAEAYPYTGKELSAKEIKGKIESIRGKIR